MAQIRICDICHGNSKQHKIYLSIKGLIAKEKKPFDDGYSSSDGFFFCSEPKYDISLDKEICVSCLDKIQKFILQVQKESEQVGKEFKNIFNPKGNPNA
jgi:hypothetical protein